MTHPLEWRPISELPDEWPEGAIGLQIGVHDVSSPWSDFWSKANYRHLYSALQNMTAYERKIIHFAFTYPPKTEEQQ